MRSAGQTELVRTRQAPRSAPADPAPADPAVAAPGRQAPSVTATARPPPIPRRSAGTRASSRPTDAPTTIVCARGSPGLLDVVASALRAQPQRLSRQTKSTLSCPAQSLRHPPPTPSARRAPLAWPSTGLQCTQARWTASVPSSMSPTTRQSGPASTCARAIPNSRANTTTTSSPRASSRPSASRPPATAPTPAGRLMGSRSMAPRGPAAWT
mmetsp:Transcript_56685/g.179145  ORF Transcript_56685/g.179145 Transcript_56685/m.179145 type:complete len:212 (+) Transcript_56685:155-790(+)